MEKGEKCKRTDDGSFLSSRLNLNASAVQILMIYDPFDVVRAACTSVGISDYEGTLRLRFLPATRCVQFDDAYSSQSSRLNTTFRQTIQREIYFNYILLGRNGTHFFNDSSWI